MGAEREVAPRPGPGPRLRLPRLHQPLLHQGDQPGLEPRRPRASSPPAPTATAVPRPSSISRRPSEARRKYQGVTFAAHKREGELKISASYTWSRTYGNVVRHREQRLGRHPPARPVPLGPHAGRLPPRHQDHAELPLHLLAVLRRALPVPLGHPLQPLVLQQRDRRPTTTCARGSASTRAPTSTTPATTATCGCRTSSPSTSSCGPTCGRSSRPTSSSGRTSRTCWPCAPRPASSPRTARGSVSPTAAWARCSSVSASGTATESDQMRYTGGRPRRPGETANVFEPDLLQATRLRPHEDGPNA